MQRWETIPPEIAKTHPLYGVGGWLIVPMFGLSATAIIIAIGIFRALSQPHPLAEQSQAFAVFLYGEQLLNVTLAVWSLTNVWLLITLRRLAVRSMIAYLALVPTLLILDLVGAKEMAASWGANVGWDQLMASNAAKTLLRSIIGALVWIPYMLLSVRVNVTYLHRVRPDDRLAASSHF